MESASARFRRSGLKELVAEVGTFRKVAVVGLVVRAIGHHGNASRRTRYGTLGQVC